MDTQQIIDTIKTLNLNINSESAVKIAEEVMRYMYWKMFINNALGVIYIIGAVIVVTALIKHSKE